MSKFDVGDGFDAYFVCEDALCEVIDHQLVLKSKVVCKDWNIRC